MRKEEKELFKSLCSFQEEGFDAHLLAGATPAVLGHLFYFRRGRFNPASPHRDAR